MNDAINSRTWFIALLFCIIFAGLGVRLYHIQVVEHEKYASISRKERIDKRVLPSQRGRILDRNGEILATCDPTREAIIERGIIEDADVCVAAIAHWDNTTKKDVRARYSHDQLKERYFLELTNTLDTYLGEEAAAFAQEFRQRKTRHQFSISKSIPYTSAEKLRDELAQKKIRGISFHQNSQRSYSHPTALCHILGFTDANLVGQEGVEKSMDDYLRGRDGYREIELDRFHREVTRYRGNEEMPINGSDVALTIDMGFQMIVEAAIDEAWSELNPEKIMVIFLKPQTGEILAMASRPNFNLSTRSGVRTNHCISDRYEPGSTFKLITLAAGYDSGGINDRMLFDCHQGKYKDGQVTLTDHHPYGMLTPLEILKKSSNIGAYLLAKQTGALTLCDYAKRFGLGQKTGIRLTAEASGRVIDPQSDAWSAPTLSRMAMGYSIDMTALQMVNVAATIANGGKLMRPYLIQSVRHPSGDLIWENQPEVRSRAISEITAGKIVQAMVSVTEDGGTATKAQVEGFRVAGKTGTAQKPLPKRKDGYYQNRYVVSFTGFLPAENPQLAGIVVVDDAKPKEGPTYGGTIAAPIFQTIAQAGLRYFEINPSQSRRVTRSAPLPSSSLPVLHE